MWVIPTSCWGWQQSLEVHLPRASCRGGTGPCKSCPFCGTPGSLCSQTVCASGLLALWNMCYAAGKEGWLVLAFCTSSSAGMVGVLGQEISYFTCAHSFVLQQPCHMLYPCNGDHINTSETRVPQQQHARQAFVCWLCQVETAVSRAMRIAAGSAVGLARNRIDLWLWDLSERSYLPHKNSTKFYISWRSFSWCSGWYYYKIKANPVFQTFSGGEAKL